MDVLAFESKIFDLGACALPNGLVMAMSPVRGTRTAPQLDRIESDIDPAYIHVTARAQGVGCTFVCVRTTAFQPRNVSEMCFLDVTKRAVSRDRAHCAFAPRASLFVLVFFVFLFLDLSRRLFCVFHVFVK